MDNQLRTDAFISAHLFINVWDNRSGTQIKPFVL
uniref:Uncharacterized protein n=1 Tax=Glaucocystis sp. BBH TaxID=2023628 RepID=A0A3G1IVJ5_9EUKA|nr:hypothetical protein [Glaucocystis sp. BBH]